MSASAESLPPTQYAVQLTGADRLELNRAKEVHRPGPTQVLAQVEAVGLCFSDLKLLKQFGAHARKGEIVSGLAPDVLAEIPSYVPGDQPTVPGHEAVVRIVAVGENVRHHKVGERCLVQTDYRALKTAGSNAALGYNFEGALQEYVLMDERVIVAPDTGERFLIAVDEQSSRAAVCLVEPWACVEDSYVTAERRTIRAGGRMLVVADEGWKVRGLAEALAPEGKPASIVAVCAEAAQRQAIVDLGCPLSFVDDPVEAEDQAFDDVVYFGAAKATLDVLNDKLGTQGVLNVVLAGRRIGKTVNVGVGRTHYGRTRWIGTASESAADSYGAIPANGEIRDGERVLVVGAGGPMGQMHVIRDVCTGHADVSVVATDVDDARLASLERKARPFAEANGVDLRLVNPQKQPLDERFTYVALMAPVPALVAEAIAAADNGCLINVFAGIPAPVKHELDLDTYIARRAFLFGTSGSRIEDMKIVLAKVQRGQIDTNCSVDAISGMAGAAEGIRAVEQRTMAGKIIVYPMLHELGLVPLSDLRRRFPTVARKLSNGTWCRAAEDELLRAARDR